MINSKAVLRLWYLVILAIAAPLFAGNRAQADIGEDPVALYRRYGKGRVHNTVIFFEVDAYTVAVYLNGRGRSEMEVVAKTKDESGQRVDITQGDPSSRPALAETELLKLLHFNANGNQWLPLRSRRRGELFWRREDGAVHAIYSPQQRTLTFMSSQGLPAAQPQPSKP